MAANSVIFESFIVLFVSFKTLLIFRYTILVVISDCRTYYIVKNSLIITTYFAIIIAIVNLTELINFYNTPTQILLYGKSIALFQSKHQIQPNFSRIPHFINLILHF
jgi:hypothetical protein